MRLTDEIHYAADPETVFAMIADPEFQEEKCVASGALEHAVDVVLREDGGARITTRRVLPTKNVPDFVRSFVGATLTVVQVDDWEAADEAGRRSGRTSVEITGAPVRLTGRLRLTGDAASAVQTIESDLKASVPLIGGKIEQAAEPAVRSAIKVERRTAAEWLAG